MQDAKCKIIFDNSHKTDLSEKFCAKQESESAAYLIVCEELAYRSTVKIHRSKQSYRAWEMLII